MQTIIKARHMLLTPTLSDYSQNKLAEATARLMDEPAARLDIELSHLGRAHDRRDMRCRAKIRVPHGRQLVISVCANDMYKAIDRAHDGLMMAVKRELRRHRGTTLARRQGRRRRPDLGSMWSIDGSQKAMSRTAARPLLAQSVAT